MVEERGGGEGQVVRVRVREVPLNKIIIRENTYCHEPCFKMGMKNGSS